jgi:hypothetical protein
VEEFPAHVVSAWLGNTERIAAQHYLQVLDSHFQKATQKTTHALHEGGWLETHGEPRNARTPCFQGVLASGMGGTGFEPVTSTV